MKLNKRRMFEMKKNEDGIGTFFRKMQGSYIVMAVAYVVFGLSLLIKPELSTTVICYAIGAVCVIYAVANLIKYFTGSMNRMYIEPDFVLSVIICVFGIVTIVRPSVIISILPFIVGIVLVFSGLIKVQDGINLKRFNYDRWFLVLGFAVISVILGIVVLLIHLEQVFFLQEWSDFSLQLTVYSVFQALSCLEKTANFIKSYSVEKELICML